MPLMPLPPLRSTYRRVNVDDIHTIAIFPPVGIARVGDSTTEYFIGPELPMNNTHGPYQPIANFRDSEQRIRRQAARFRVYAHNNENKVIAELNEKTGFRLTWRVHVKNTKAAADAQSLERRGQQRNPDVRDRASLAVDPGAQVIVSNEVNRVVELNGTFKVDQRRDVEVNLGQLQVDDAGRLLFIPAKGASMRGDSTVRRLDPVPEGIDNEGWVDDVCDGWVSVNVQRLDPAGNLVGGQVPAQLVLPSKHRAAVISGPPKFAWGIHNFTTLFDIFEAAYHQAKVKEVEAVQAEANAAEGVDQQRLQAKVVRLQREVDATRMTEFYTHIYPVLLSASSAAWVHADANTRHSGEALGNFIRHIDTLSDKSIGLKQRKREIFNKLRKPGVDQGTRDRPANMPFLGVSDSEDPRWAKSTLTELQYERFSRWKEHDFTATPPVKYSTIENVPLDLQPVYLTRANLETTVGCSLNPGMETGKIVIEDEDEDEDDSIYDETVPFRLKWGATIQPGDLTAKASLPWQTDFFACTEAWWPSARPTSVKTARGGMAVKWDRDIRTQENMMKWWNRLGFVTVFENPHVTGVEDFSYFESERLDIPPEHEHSE